MDGRSSPDLPRLPRGRGGLAASRKRGAAPCYRPGVPSRPPRSVVLAIAAAALIGLELLAVAVFCVPLLASGEARFRAAVTCVMCVAVAIGVFAFISGALRQKPEARATAVGWCVPLAASLGAFALMLGLLALLLDARPALVPLLAFVAVVVMPTGTIALALLRPSARAWFEGDGSRERRRSRRPWSPEV